MRGQASDTAAVHATSFTQVCLEQLRKDLHASAIDKHRDQYHTPRNLLLALIAEIGVLAELFRWRGEVPSSLSDWSSSERQDVGRELSGVLLYLIRMADVCGVDLGRAALDKMSHQEPLGPSQSDLGLSGSQQGSPQQQQRKQQQQQYSGRAGVGGTWLGAPRPGQLGAAPLPAQEQQQHLTAQQGLPFQPSQQQQWLSQVQQQQQQPPLLLPRPLPQRQQTARAGSPVSTTAPAAAGRASQGSIAATLQGLVSPGGTAAAMSPISSSISSISVGLLRQLAMLSSINPSAAIGLLTANPAATASLMAAITDPNHQVSALLSAALNRSSASSGTSQGLGGAAAGLWGTRGAAPGGQSGLSSGPTAAAAAALSGGVPGPAPTQQQPQQQPQQQQQQGRLQLTQQQQALLNEIVAAAVAARSQPTPGLAAPTPSPAYGPGPGAFANVPAPTAFAPPAPAGAAAAPAKLQLDPSVAASIGGLFGPAAAAAAAAAAGGEGPAPFAGAAAPITPPAGTAVETGATVLPAFAAAAAAAATPAGSGGEPPHSGPSTGRQQQRQPALLPHRHPQQQVSMSHSVGTSSGAEGTGGGDLEGVSSQAQLFGKGGDDQPIHEAAHAPQQQQQQQVGLQPGPLPPAAAAAAAGPASSSEAAPQRQQQQQQQLPQVPVRQQLDQQQLTHLTQIAQAAHWSFAALSAEQREAVCSTLGIGVDLLQRFFEEESVAAPRGVKRGLDRP